MAALPRVIPVRSRTFLGLMAALVGGLLLLLWMFPTERFDLINSGVAERRHVEDWHQSSAAPDIQHEEKTVTERQSVNVTVVQDSERVESQTAADPVRQPDVAAVQYGVVHPEIYGRQSSPGSAQRFALERGRQEALRLVRRYLDLAARKLAVAVPGYTGNPVSEPMVKKVLIVTSWRSGSTFLGDIVSSHPLAFYVFEPLQDLDDNSKTSPPSVRQRVLRGLLQCDFNVTLSFPHLARYLDFFHEHSGRVHQACRQLPDVCHDLLYLSQACSLYPVRVVKTVRALLPEVAPLMAEDPGLRVILLVRDPRGSVNSRQQVSWCMSRCNSTELLCQEMQTNLEAAADLERRYPGQLLTVQYERLAEDVAEQTRRIFSFLQLNVESKTTDYLLRHTGQQREVSRELLGQEEVPPGVGSGWTPAQRKLTKNPQSTYRDSRLTASRWRQNATFQTVSEVQDQCATVIHLLNHTLFTSEAELRDGRIPLQRT